MLSLCCSSLIQPRAGFLICHQLYFVSAFTDEAIWPMSLFFPGTSQHFVVLFSHRSFVYASSGTGIMSFI